MRFHIFCGSLFLVMPWGVNAELIETVYAMRFDGSVSDFARGVGDTNGDGLGDFALPSGVVLGTRSPPRNLTASLLNGENGFRITTLSGGGSWSGLYPRSIHSCDIDGDNYSEVIIGGFSKELLIYYDGAAAIRGRAHFPPEVLFKGPLTYSSNASVAFIGSVSLGGTRVKIICLPSMGAGQMPILAIRQTGGGGNFIARWVASLPLPTTRIDIAQLPQVPFLANDIFPIGDANGDGDADFAVSGKGADNWDIVHLSYSSREAPPNLDVSIRSSQPDEGLGMEIAGGSDVDGDGINDIIIGAPYWSANAGELGKGAIYVIYGHTFNSLQQIDLGALSPQYGFRVAGERPGDNLGYSIANIGDINGDGFRDLGIGAPGADFGGTKSGSLYVMYGGAHEFDYSNIRDAAALRLDGTGPDWEVGRTVDGVGDFNGDNVDDYIVGAPGALGGSAGNGSVFLILGKSGIVFADGFE